jgi:hypothetical protein
MTVHILHFLMMLIDTAIIIRSNALGIASKGFKFIDT